MQKVKNVKSSYSLLAGIDISNEYYIVNLIHQQGNKLNYDQFSYDEKGSTKFIPWITEMLKSPFPLLMLCMEHNGLYSRELIIAFMEEQMSVSVESSLQIKKSSGLLRGKSGN